MSTIKSAFWNVHTTSVNNPIPSHVLKLSEYHWVLSLWIRGFSFQIARIRSGTSLTVIRSLRCFYHPIFSISTFIAKATDYRVQIFLTSSSCLHSMYFLNPVFLLPLLFPSAPMILEFGTQINLKPKERGPKFSC